jgi:hypothetical protein
MQRQVDQVGGDLFGISVHGHALNVAGREKAYDALANGTETLSGLLRQTAAFMESVQDSWPRGPLANVQLGGDPPSQCNTPCGMADALRQAAETVCLVAAGMGGLCPPCDEACALAASAWTGAYAVCIVCRLFG